MCSNFRPLASIQQVNDAAKLCFVAAFGFAVFGAAGQIVNQLAPGTTNLGNLFWIGCFYFGLGLLEQRTGARQQAKCDTTAVAGRVPQPAGGSEPERRAA